MSRPPRDAERHGEIDVLKAAGIVTVVLIHALRPPWDPGVSDLEVFLGHATRFGVPAFLFASGFLYAGTGRVGWATTRTRLVRILVPYAIASALAQLWRISRGLPPESGAVWSDLLLASSFGPYYYVFVIVGLVLVTPAIARLPRRAVALATVGFVAAQWAVDAASVGMLPLHWHLRSPLLWWAYFLLGWTVRQHLAPLRAVLDAHAGALRAGLLVAVVALTGLSALEGSAPRLWVRSAAWLDVYAILALLFAAAHRSGTLPAPVRFLSDATYAVYLFHLFFVLGARDHLPPPEGTAAWDAIAIPWALGLAGPLALVAAARAALGPRSRTLLGA